MDGSSGDDRSGSPQSGGIMEVESRTALPFPGQQAVPTSVRNSRAGGAVQFGVCANPILTTFGAQHTGFPSPKCPKPKAAAKRHQYVVGVGVLWTETEHGVRGCCLQVDEAHGCISHGEQGKGRNGCLLSVWLEHLGGWQYQPGDAEREVCLDVLSGRCLLG